MTVFITGVITDKGREIFAKSFGNVGGFPISYAKYFKIGEGGYIFNGVGNVPKTPNPALTDVEATGAPGDYFFQKDFSAADIVFIAPSTIRFRCKVLPTEANDDGLGNSPKFFEIGIFDQNDNMMGYCTFDEQTKNASKTITTFVQFYF